MTRWTNAAKAAVLAPLAALSVAWTAAVLTVEASDPVSSTTAPSGGGTLPDGTTVPTEAIRAPASVSRGHAMSADSAAQAVASASTNEIPSAALAAYQRAEAIINTADESCHLPWQLVAAIGRVESDHGRHGGNSLDAGGTATPGIVGPRLDGRRGTREITDTDGGELDRDQRFDRAVGPMQFIPSTWSVVGVDADGDGVRDPQDVDDAALASAVYLCAGQDDLATEPGQRAAVFRYNRSEEYVDLVLAIMAAYLAGDYTSVPNSTVAGGYLTPIVPAADDPRGGSGGGGDEPKGPGEFEGGPDVPSPPPTTAPTGGPTDDPTGGPSGGPTGGPTGGPSSGPTGGPTVDPTVPATPLPSPSLPLPSVPLPSLPLPTPTLLTEAEAIVVCLAQGLIDNPLDLDDAFDRCVAALLKP